MKRRFLFFFFFSSLSYLLNASTRLFCNLYLVQASKLSKFSEPSAILKNVGGNVVDMKSTCVCSLIDYRLEQTMSNRDDNDINVLALISHTFVLDYMREFEMLFNFVQSDVCQNEGNRCESTGDNLENILRGTQYNLQQRNKIPLHHAIFIISTAKVGEVD